MPELLVEIELRDDCPSDSRFWRTLGQRIAEAESESERCRLLDWAQKGGFPEEGIQFRLAHPFEEWPVRPMAPVILRGVSPKAIKPRRELQEARLTLVEAAIDLMKGGASVSRAAFEVGAGAQDVYNYLRRHPELTPMLPGYRPKRRRTGAH